MPETKLKVFLCHSSSDKPIVRELYRQLSAEGWMDVWLDEEELYPGQDWNLEIEKAVRVTHTVIACVTQNSATKEGYIQRELRLVLDVALNMPDGTIFVIPFKLEECELPIRLGSLQYANYFKEDRERAYKRLLVSLNKRADSLGISTEKPVQKIKQEYAPKIYNSQLNREIKEIAECVDHFFLYQRMGNYKDAIGNGRILAEAVGRLVFLRSEYYKDHPEKMPSFANLIDLCKKYNIISDELILKALDILKREGNPAHHPGETFFSDVEFKICQPEVIRLVTWLFTEYLHFPIPSEIEDDLNGKKKPLPIFQLAENMDLGVFKSLKNNLVFFTPAEQQIIQSVCKTLINSRQALLVGHPASGKSILALTIAKTIKEQGYQAYYASFKHGIQHDFWDDILPLLDEKILFVVDDCHLNIKDATNLYFRWHGQNSNACLLFISRQIAKDVQESTESDLSMFDELQEQTFSSELVASQNADKITGIVLLYKHYFENKYKKPYDIGDIYKLIKQVYADLFLLSCYLDVWEFEHVVLSEIDHTRVLKNIYGRYWRSLDLDQTACLLRYASLYYFEIPFEPLPTDESATNGLLEKGLLQRDTKFCIMYHSSFAELLIDAYITEKALIINRQYRNTERKREEFLCDQVRDYITSFIQKYDYPLNLQIIIGQLIVYPETNKVFGRNILLGLIQNGDIKKSIINCYSDKDNIGDISSIRRLFGVISSKHPDLLFDVFDAIFSNHSNFKSLLLQSQYALSDYYVILNMIKQDKDRYDLFLLCLTQDEKNKIFLKHR